MFAVGWCQQQTGPRRSGGSRRLGRCWPLFASWLWPAVAGAASLGAAGSGQDLWIAQGAPDGKALTILHRRDDDEADQLRVVTAHMPGTLADGGMVAGEDRLWLIYETLAVYSLRYMGLDTNGRWPHYGETTVEKRLPQAVKLRAAAAERRLWVLVSASNPGALAGLDQLVPQLEPAQADKSPNGLPTREETLSAAKPDVAESASEGGIGVPAASSVQPGLAQDRLIRLHGNRWVKVDMPSGWPHGARCWLFLDDQRPRLLAQVQDDGGDQMREYRLGADGWGSDSYPLRADGQSVPILVESQVVVGWQTAQSTGPDLTLELLRHQIPMGRLAIDAPGPWSLVSLGQHAVLVAGASESDLFWTRMDLRGNVVPAARLRVEKPTFWIRYVDFVLWAGTIAIATLIMLIYWRRDPQTNRLELPTEFVVGDFGRRIGAAVVDLAPCVVAALAFFDVGIDIYAQWPGHARSWTDTIPGAFVMGVYIGHCLLTETFTARTLGKALFGLRVTDLRGGAPNVWQVLARNFMKVFDLIAPPLLILPLVGPYRQRLGDMVGRTVVVIAAPNDGPRGDTSDQDEADEDKEKSARRNREAKEQ